MAQENYVEGCSMQRPPLIEPNRFCFWKSRFKTYVKSKDIELWHVIQNGNFYFEVEDSETKLMKETTYELLKDEQKKQLGKNNESKMTLYNALPYPNYSSKNHVRKFLRTLPLKWRAKVMSIEEAKYLATLPLDELVGNLKVYKMILENDGVVSKTTTKENVKSLALKAKVTREQTSEDSDSQDGSNEDVDEEEAKSFNLFGKGRGNSFRNKGGESSKQKGAYYNCIIEGYFASECRKPKENKAFIGGAWSDSENGNELQNDATCLMAIDSQEVYDGRHVIFGSSLKGKVVSRVSFTKVDCTISKNGKTQAKGHRRNGLYTCKLGDNSKQQIYLASVVDNSTLWHRRLGHANMSLPSPKLYPSVEDDRINEPIVQDLNRSPSLQVNVSDEGYPKSLKEARGHPMEQVIGELNERTLRSKTKQA
ncbi:zf-CCHC domain-containing protein [Tanacetum coccineum]